MATNADRVRNRAMVIERVESAFAQWEAAPLLARLAEAGIPSGKVRDIDEVYAWAQVASQGLILDVEHPVLGPIRLPGSPIRFDDNAFSGGREEHLPPPQLGEHDAAIRAWLGMGDKSPDGDPWPTT